MAFRVGDKVAVQLPQPSATFPNSEAGDWIPGTVALITADGRYQVNADSAPGSNDVNIFIADARRMRAQTSP